MTEKKCTKCNEWKLYTEFYKNKNSKDGYAGQCKACMEAYQQANKERIAKQKHKWYEANCSKRPEWREYNRSRVAEWQKSNREHRLKYMREWCESNRDSVAEYYSKYRIKNLEKYKTFEAKRRALKKSASTTDPWELQQIALFYADCPDGYHVDHIVPLALGGTHTLDNLQYLVARLNQSKNDKHPDDWDDPRPISCRA